MKNKLILMFLFLNIFCNENFFDNGNEKIFLKSDNEGYINPEQFLNTNKFLDEWRNDYYKNTYQDRILNSDDEGFICPNNNSFQCDPDLVNYFDEWTIWSGIPFYEGEDYVFVKKKIIDSIFDSNEIENINYINKYKNLIFAKKNYNIDGSLKDITIKSKKPYSEILKNCKFEYDFNLGLNDNGFLDFYKNKESNSAFLEFNSSKKIIILKYFGKNNSIENTEFFKDLNLNFSEIIDFKKKQNLNILVLSKEKIFSTKEINKKIISNNLLNIIKNYCILCDNGYFQCLLYDENENIIAKCRFNIISNQSFISIENDFDQGKGYVKYFIFNLLNLLFKKFKKKSIYLNSGTDARNFYKNLGIFHRSDRYGIFDCDSRFFYNKMKNYPFLNWHEIQW